MSVTPISQKFDVDETLLSLMLSGVCDYYDWNLQEVLIELRDDALDGKYEQFIDWQEYALHFLDDALNPHAWRSLSMVTRLVVYIQAMEKMDNDNDACERCDAPELFT